MSKKTSENVFVMFYAPWCGHCQTVKPHFLKAHGGKAVDYNEFKNSDVKGGTQLVMVNGDEHPKILEKFGIDGFPSFKLFKGVSNRKRLSNLGIKDYSGERNSNAFNNFLKNVDLKGQSGGGSSNNDQYYKLYKKYKAKYKSL